MPLISEQADDLIFLFNISEFQTALDKKSVVGRVVLLALQLQSHSFNTFYLKV